jgi:hypothetical protein
VRRELEDDSQGMAHCHKSTFQSISPGLQVAHHPDVLLLLLWDASRGSFGDLLVPLVSSSMSRTSIRCVAKCFWDHGDVSLWLSSSRPGDGPPAGHAPPPCISRSHICSLPLLIPHNSSTAILVLPHSFHSSQPSSLAFPNIRDVH